MKNINQSIHKRKTKTTPLLPDAVHIQPRNLPSLRRVRAIMESENRNENEGLGQERCKHEKNTPKEAYEPGQKAGYRSNLSANVCLSNLVEVPTPVINNPEAP